MTIDSALSGVVDLQPFEYVYNLGFDVTKNFSMNSYYQYYDSIQIVFPDSNFSGNLNSNYTYFNYLDPYSPYDWLVSLNCSFGNSNYTEYNYVGDVNVTLACSEYNIALWISPHDNYNQTFTVVASNDVNFSIGEFKICSHNCNLFPGQFYGPLRYNESLDNKSFGDYSSDLEGLFPDPDSISRTLRYLLMFVVIAFFFCLCFFGIYKTTGITSLFVYVFLFFLVSILFFFFRIDYVSVVYPVFLTFGVLFYNAFKFIRGGF